MVRIVRDRVNARISVFEKVPEMRNNEWDLIRLPEFRGGDGTGSLGLRLPTLG